MIGGRKKIILNPQSILSKITEYDIFKYYMPNNNWKINEATFSPFRNEKNPSFLIGDRKGGLTFIDYTDTSKKGDCFTFVKTLYNLNSMDDVLKMIDKDFLLGISSGVVGNYKKIISEYKQPVKVSKNYSLVQVKTKKFTNLELRYWNEYYQDIEDLKKHNVYSLDKVYLNKQLFSIPKDELAFGYYYEGSWKIYRPFALRRIKWVPNNVPITTLEGKDNIINCNVAFINKSKKDHMVISKLLSHSCAVQNEGLACFSDENVDYLKANSKRQILSFDSDAPGVKNSQQITKLLDFDYCNVPRKYLSEGIKDWADLAKERGLKTVEKYLKQKQLI